MNYEIYKARVIEIERMPSGTSRLDWGRVAERIKLEQEWCADLAKEHTRHYTKITQDLATNLRE